jgi:hypothetical protein
MRKASPAALIPLLLLLAAGPSTRPANETELRSIIADLRGQNAELRAENASLKRELLLHEQSTPTAKPKSTISSRAEEYIQGGRAAIESTGYSQRVVAMPVQPQEAAAVRHAAAARDKAIGDYVAANNVPQEESESLYAGIPALGMNEAELRLLGNVSIKGESLVSTKGAPARGKSLTLWVWTPRASTWQQQAADTYSIELIDGKVAESFRPSGQD